MLKSPPAGRYVQKEAAMGETRMTRVQQLQEMLRPWQRQQDLLLGYVLRRVVELEQLGGVWLSVPPRA